MSLNRLARLAAPSLLLLACSFVTALGQTRIIIDTGTLDFVVPATGQLPAAKIIQVDTSNPQAGPLTISTSASSTNNWLQFTQDRAFTPVRLEVRAVPGTLQPGTHQGELVMTAPGATNAPLRVTATLTIQGTATTFTVNPAQLTFDVQTNGPVSAAQTVNLTSSGGAVTFSTSAQTDNGVPWLQAAISSNTTPATINATVSPGSLGAGSYNGRIVVTPSNGLAAQTINVRMNVGALPTLNITPQTMQFFYQTGTMTLPAPQNLSISTSAGTATFSVAANTNAGGSWLVPGTLQGTATTTAQNFAISIGTIAQQLSPGNYTGALVFTANGVSNSPVTIPVTLQISSNPLITLGTTPAPFTYQTGGPLPPVQKVSVGLSSGTIPFAVSTSMPAGQNWLRVTPTTGTLPAMLDIDLNPNGIGGLTPGKYTGRVEINATGAANTPRTFDVELNVTASNQLTANPSTITFNYQTTTNRPPDPQLVEVTAVGQSVRFDAATVTNNCGGSWLTTAPTTGTTPQNISVAVTVTGITPPQTCTGRLTLTAQGSATVTNVPVTFNVAASPLLNIAPSALVFTAPAGGTSPAPRALLLNSTDQVSNISFTAGASTTAGGTWLTLSGNTIGTAPTSLSVNVNSAGLQPGTYEGSVTVTSSGLPAPQSIPVTLIVTPNTTISVTPNALTFNMLQGGTNPAAQTVNVTSSSAALPFTASATSLGNWLSVTPVNGSTPTALSVSVNGAGLVPSTYEGTITVFAPGAQNPTQTITVRLVVGLPVSLTPSLSVVNFNYALGASAPPAQVISLTTGTGTVNFNAVATTNPAGGTWINVTPASGTAPGSISISVNPANLVQGTYNGTVSVTPVGVGTPLNIPVTLTVTAAPAPVILGVANAASFQPGPIVPGEFVYFSGTNIGPTTLTEAGLAADGTRSTTAADTQILFDNIPGPIFYVSSNQSVAIVPYEIFGRPTVQVVVRRAGQTSAPVTLTVGDASPAFFTNNSAGTGQAAALNQNNSRNGSTNPAIRGQVVVLYGTGEGQLTPGGVTGAITPGRLPLPVPRLAVTATIGGRPAVVEYAGPAPGLVAGVFQLNVRIPEDAPVGQPDVVVRVGNNQSPPVTVAVGQ